MYDVSNMLGRIRLFQNLDVRQLIYLSSRLKKQTLVAGEIVYYAGDASDCLYVVYRGCIQDFELDEQGNRVSVDQFDAGQAFGESGLLENIPRSSFAMATKPTYLFKLEAADFQDMVAWWPALARNLMQEVEVIAQPNLLSPRYANGFQPIAV